MSIQPLKNSNDVETMWQRIHEQIIGENDDRLYADWTASGRLYQPIEDRISNTVGRYMANTHTEESVTGRTMTHWYQESVQHIKKHVNANSEDVLISVGNGMTGALAKLIRMLGWWAHENHKTSALSSMDDRPLVYITHREHHSNQTMWLESLAELRIIPSLAGDYIDIEWLEKDLAKEAHRKVKVASITAASNVTGIVTPYHKIAQIMHENGGLCFVDFAASAPYVDIDMHPSELESLDAIYFSPHKFLGGPGTNGVLVFNGRLYTNDVPELPGGGTVVWTNPWGEHRFVSDVEQRESGGTPGILQTIKVAMVVKLKEEMGVENILAKEKLINSEFFARLHGIEGVQVLSGHHRDRLSIFSIIFEQVDYHQAVTILSEQYGIETRGGCACAGTYGHHLLNIDHCMSNKITDEISEEHQESKPGWVRVSFHPSMSIADVHRIADAIAEVATGKATNTNSLNFAPVPNIWQSLLS
ncbi:aminotransferase class V-fold PLP-dependent enzyme [Reinekea sp.]|jgi:selenocysteine lyase/cysteine desulfurase|uniref:aminotransferase class V-fold PLP-dependent enzyme n=1 Tax=Reinekea sp. TaxID=1970455 RepID=UPI003989C887